MEIESLKPLLLSQITHFGFWGAKILDNDYLCLADSQIKKLDMSITHFKIDELARLVASIPDLTGEITKPYKESTIIKNGEKTTYSKQNIQNTIIYRPCSFEHRFGFSKACW